MSFSNTCHCNCSHALMCILFSQKAVFSNHAQHTKTEARNAELIEGYRTILSLKGCMGYASSP